MKKVTACLLLLLFVAKTASAQMPLLEVKGLPTNEIYDLLVDKKGFLWVGHDMGISRFDGLSFTHFSHPSRSSLSMTDLIEDDQGRIWCHNYTGQVFYIEDGEMHWLSAYKNEEESYLPRMVFCDGEVVITSQKGLFVCDTKSLQGQYHKSENSIKSSTYSLITLGKKVIACDPSNWFMYSKKTGMKKIRDKLFDIKWAGYSLYVSDKEDEFFFVVKPSSKLYKLLLNDENIEIAEIIDAHKFIHSIQYFEGKLWMHSNQVSETFDRKTIITGFSISDAAVDSQGNFWFSSLGKGLWIQPKSELQNSEFANSSEIKDLIKCLKITEKYIIIGTSSSSIAILDRKNRKLIWSYKLDSKGGAVNYISDLVDSCLLISTSSVTLKLNFENKILDTLALFNTKEACFTGDNVLIASPNGLGLLSFSELKLFNKLESVTIEKWVKLWLSENQNYKKNEVQCLSFYVPLRSRSVTYDSSNKTIYASFINGLYTINSYGIQPFIYEGEKVYSNSIQYAYNKVFIGTLNRGLIVKDNDQLTSVNTTNGLFSNTIVKIKAVGKYLWIFEDNSIQLFDIEQNKIINNYELPPVTGSNVYDVDAIDDTAYLATNAGVYTVFLKPSEIYNSFRSYLTNVTANGKVINAREAASLTYRENDIQINLAIPWYSPSQPVNFKYRLKSSGDTTNWFTTSGSERSIRFASLMPGSYTFESYAVVSGFQEKSPIVFQFTIAKPWWEELWFIAVVSLTLIAAILSLYYFRLHQLMKIEKMRRKISGDLHDEIGSTVSSINIYSELAKTEVQNKDYLNLIQENTREVISKLDDLVWSINPKNDTLQQLISRMRLFGEPLLTGAGIQPDFVIHEAVYQMELPIHVKQNVYLIFKEAVNNTAKHSAARNCTITISYDHKMFNMEIQDDGVGFDKAASSKKGRNGLSNIMERSRQISAKVVLLSGNGEGTKLSLSVPFR